MVLQELPPEVIENILTYLTPIDILRTSWCCKTLQSIANNEQVWVKCALREYSVDLRNSIRRLTDDKYSDNQSTCTSARIFTIKILMHFGSYFKELWQLESHKYYGGLAKLLYHDWCVYLVVLDPPPHPHTEERLQPDILCRIYLNKDDESIFETYFSNQKQQIGHGIPLQILHSELNAKMVSTWKPLSYEFMRNYLNETYLAIFRKRFGLPYLDLAAQRLLHRNEFLNSKQQHFTTFRPYNTVIPPFHPIRPGLFKGTYSSHGIEIINLLYEDDLKTITGRKVTGDPNVPCDKVSFQAYLDQAMHLTLEDKKSFERIRDVMTSEEGIQKIPSEKDQTAKPFAHPNNCRIDASIERDIFKTELWRFQARCQVSPTGYIDPKFIQGNFIVFSEDTFGVIFIDLQSLGIFDRVQEPLCNNSNFADVLQKLPEDILGQY